MGKKQKILLSEQEFIDYLLNSLKKTAKDFSIKDFFSKKDEKKPSEPTKSITRANINFEDVTSKIIDQLEGGYYHPDMLLDGRIKDARYGGSGETMFGIDRLNSGAKNTPQYKEFWRLIDAQNARKKWKYNYKLQDNPTLARRLKNLVAEIMEPLFLDYQKNLTPKAKQIVNSDPRLYYHFAYATWNGIGWFRRFAKKFNEQVDMGMDTEDLVKFVIQQRKNSSNSLIAQTGRKIERILNNMA